jgi:gluconate 2-dehydrogenase gamma chain
VPAGGAAILLSVTTAQAKVSKGELSFQVDSDVAPAPVTDSSWRFCTMEEGRIVETLVDHLIPPDAETPGGRGAGCAVFVDRQSAGSYGRFAGHYGSSAFAAGLPQQGYQSPQTPADQYRLALASLPQYCSRAYGGAPFHQITDDQKDQVISGLEHGTISPDNIDAKAFFKLLLIDTQTGLFADPVCGGNRGMVAWRMAVC